MHAALILLCVIQCFIHGLLCSEMTLNCAVLCSDLWDGECQYVLLYQSHVSAFPGHTAVCRGPVHFQKPLNHGGFLEGKMHSSSHKTISRSMYYMKYHQKL